MSYMHILMKAWHANVPGSVRLFWKSTGAFYEHLIDARGLMARDGYDHVLQVKLCERLILDVHKRLAARY